MRSIIVAAVCVLIMGCGDDSGDGPPGSSGGEAGEGGGSLSGGVSGVGGVAGGLGGEGGGPAGSGAGGEGGVVRGNDGGAGEGAVGGSKFEAVSLVIQPSGRDGHVEITGPTEFSAELTNGDGPITWEVTGGGTLSLSQGEKVLFTPPTGTASETLTASAAGISASVVITSSPPTLTGAIVPGLSAPVTVLYDAQDIPHIQCATKEDCLAVQGYVQAHDRLFPMDFLRHVARSTLAELIGTAGLEQDAELRTLLITRAGHRLEDDLVAAMDGPTKALLLAYVGGINAYLAELRANPEALPGEYSELPFPIAPSDIADWTIADSVALIRLQQFQLSEDITEESAFAQFAAVYGPSGAREDLGKLSAWIRAASPASERAHTLSGTSLARLAKPLSASTALPNSALSSWRSALSSVRARFTALKRKLRPRGAELGSNNWVVSAGMSSTHSAMLANDPHIALRYPPLFHLSALTSSEASDNLNLVGGTFPGLPGALVGRGANVSWGLTVAGYDVTDLYLEQFLPQASCPTPAPCVLFKGAPTSTLVVPQTFMVRVGPGASGLVDAGTLGIPSLPAVVLVVPQHGPLIVAPDEAGHAISARWTGQEGNTQDLKAILGLNMASDVDSAASSLQDFSTGAQNFLLADDQGHIAYNAHALVPVRSFAGSAPPWFPLPGDGSAEWGDDSNCAAATLTPVPASCWIASDLLPHGKDPAQGYFVSANADPIGHSDNDNPLDDGAYLSFNWDDSTGFRATRITERLEQIIANDGSVSLEDMESIQSDHVSRPGMGLTEYVSALPTSASDPPSLVEAKAVLTQWATDGWDCPAGLLGSDPSASAVDAASTVTRNSAGCFFFHAFLRTLITNVFNDDLAVAGLEVDEIQATKAIFLLLLEGNTPAGAAGSAFCDDVDGTGALIAEHTCESQVNSALVVAYDALAAAHGATTNWRWGRAHTLQLQSLSPFASPSYAPGPFARPGGAFTVDVGTPLLSGPSLDFPYTSGANVRHVSVMDPDAPSIQMQLPGPERDTAFPSDGPDLLGEYLSNTYFHLAFGDQIDGSAVAIQVFTAE